MEEESGQPQQRTWYRWAAGISAFLFALLWSIGPVFFWTFLMLTLYFAFLIIYSSGITFPSFSKNSGDSQNPFRAYQRRSDSSTTASTQQIVGKVIRIFLIGFGGLILLLFIIGIFSGDEDTSDVPAESSEIETPSESSNEEADIYNTQGNSYYGKAQYDSALYYYEKALAVDPENKYAMYNKALVYFSRQDFRTSIQLVRKCLRANPEYNEAYWLLGDDYFSINVNDSAAYYLEQAYNNDYRDAGFLELMGDVYQKRGDQARAVALYKEAVVQDPTRTDLVQKILTLDPAYRNPN